MRSANVIMTRLFLLAVLGILTWSPAVADEVRLRVRSIPSDVTVWQDGLQVPRDQKDGAFLLARSEELVELELRAVGHRSETVQLQIKPEQTLVDLPQDERQVIYLRPLVKEVQFQTEPTSMVYLQTGEDRHFLGSSSQPVVVPLGARTSGPLVFIFETAGYRAETLEMEPDQFQADRLPAEGALKLKPLIPLVSPVVKWLSTRKSLSVTILILLSLGILVLLRKLILGRARATE
jgi:hypothetical protein